MAKPRNTHFADDNLSALIASGEWQQDDDPLVIPYEDEDTLEEAIRAAVVITRWIGGAVTIANHRTKIGPESFLPGEYIWSWNSFFPVREVEAQEEPAEEREPEPAEAA